MPRKLTQSEFEEKVKKFNDEYVAITPYIDYKTNVYFKHLKCGNVIRRRPGDFFQGKTCTKCSSKSNKDKWKEKFFEINEEALKDFELIGDWDCVKSKTKFKHTTCGTTFSIRPNNFRKYKFKCPKCSGRKIVDKDDFMNIIKNEFNNEFELLEEYKVARKEILMKHKICNEEFYVKPINFINRKDGCEKCESKSHKIFKDKIFNLVGEDYSVIGIYTSSAKNIDMKHNKCGNVWSVRPSNFLIGSRCPKCANKMKRSNEEVQKLISDTLNNRYTLIGDFKGSKKKIKVKDNLTKKEFECFLNSLLVSKKYRNEV